MTRFTRLGPSLIAAALLFTGPAPSTARADSTQKDELAKGEWEGKHQFDTKPAGSGGGTPTPDPSGGGGGSTTTPPPSGTAGGSGGTGTSTPSPSTNTPPADAGTTTGGTPVTTDAGAAGTTQDPGSPPTPGTGTDPDAPPPQATTPTAPPPPTPGPGTGGGGGGGSPMPDPGTSACGAKWVLKETKASPEFVCEQTMWTLLILRTDVYAFICNAYARSESTLFLDWFTQRTASTSNASRESSENFKDYEVELELVGACPGCSPKILVDGLCSAEAKAQVKPVESFLPVDRGSMARAASNSGWNAPVNCNVNSSAAAAGGTGALTLTADLGVVKISSQSGGGVVTAVDFNSLGDQAVVNGGYVKVKIRDFGDVFAFSTGDNSNVQAKARVGYDLSLRGTTKCGAFGQYKETLQTR